MRKSERYTRVRLDDTDAKVTVGTVFDGMTELDEPATDSSGRPLPDEPSAPKKTSATGKKAATKTTATKAAAKKTASAPAKAPTTSGGNAAAVS